MTKEWFETKTHPKYFRWNGALWHEDDYLNYIMSILPDLPDDATEDEASEMLDIFYYQGIRESESITEEDSVFIKKERKKLLEKSMAMDKSFLLKNNSLPCPYCGSTKTYKKGYRQKCKICNNLFSRENT